LSQALRPAERRVGGPSEIADRLALRALVDEYAAVADARDHGAFAALFTPEGRFLAYRYGSPDALRDANGAAELFDVMDNLDAFEQTMHVMANHRIFSIDGDRAAGEVYGLAHHLSKDEPGENLVMHIAYDDLYARVDGAWLFEQRTLTIRWLESRPVAPAELVQ
jgi:sigma54-dependent transcription regulator